MSGPTPTHNAFFAVLLFCFLGRGISWLTPICRYTVHEKAQHFAAPVPLRNAWHDEQVDEFFSSLLGGAGLAGAGTEGALPGQGLIAGGDEGMGDLGELRVF